MLRAALPQTPEERHPGPAQQQRFQQLRDLLPRHDLSRQLSCPSLLPLPVFHSRISVSHPEHANSKSSGLIAPLTMTSVTGVTAVKFSSITKLRLRGIDS
ncbi:hypothetical protein HN011_007368 [Eciton burchellii]|nr:hypothetical protein HN011_007368 [Eciton burchellii]